MSNEKTRTVLNILEHFLNNTDFLLEIYEHYMYKSYLHHSQIDAAKNKHKNKKPRTVPCLLGTVLEPSGGVSQYALLARHEQM